MIQRCSICGRDMTVAAEVYHEVIGWEKPRRGGGTNALALRRLTGKVACSGCISRKKSKISPGQQTLV